MTERVTLKPGDYVSTEGMDEELYENLATAFMEAGCKGPIQEFEYVAESQLFGWSKVFDQLGHNKTPCPSFSRRLTHDQVLGITNAGGQTQDTLTTILESAAEHDAKAKHHADEHERLMQQARDMLPEGWRLVRDEKPEYDMSDPANWREGDVVTCMKTDKDHAGDFEYGHTYTVNKPVTDFGWVSCIVSGAETNSLPADHFRFHHRPNT